MLHMALYIEVERGFTFSIKRTLSKIGLLLHHQGDYQHFLVTLCSFLEHFPLSFFYLCKLCSAFFRFYVSSQISASAYLPYGPTKERNTGNCSICYLWMHLIEKKKKTCTWILESMIMRVCDQTISNKWFSQQR